jgi:ElaB/YqjD/DUF883 family membrane-anchored ribosome-binding protein
MFTATVLVDLSVMLDGSGVNVYIGDAEMPTKSYTLTELMDNLLDAWADENDKVYEELSADIDDLLSQFKACVQMIEDAKN